MPSASRMAGTGAANPENGSECHVITSLPASSCRGLVTDCAECAVIAHRRALWWAVCAHSADESYPTLSEGFGLMFWFARKRLSGS